MCRFVFYMGPPITLDLLTTRPEFSIIHQSYKSRMRTEPLNGDGFGVSWYVPDISPVPAVFRSIQPAWNNNNLLELARVTRSGTILAHVRAATRGTGVAEANCHPFTSGNLAFMHNGSVAEFTRLKRHLQARLSDDCFASIRGTTDSEHIFALLQDQLRTMPGERSAQRMANALEKTFHIIDELAAHEQTTRRAFLNVAVSDGRRAVISRASLGGAMPPSLFIHVGKKYECDDGVCRMVETTEAGRAVIVASEPLTEEPGWNPVPVNHAALIHTDLTVSFKELDLPAPTVPAGDNPANHPVDGVHPAVAADGCLVPTDET